MTKRMRVHGVLVAAWLGAVLVPGALAGSIEGAVKTKYWRYEVIGCERLKVIGKGEHRHVAGGSYVLIKFRATNTDRHEALLRLTLFKLTDATGATRQVELIPDEDIKAALGDDYCTCNVKRVQPGVSVNCVLVYDAPEKLDGFSLEVYGGIADPGLKGSLEFRGCGQAGGGGAAGKMKGWLERLKGKFRKTSS